MNERFDDRKKAMIARFTPLTPEELNNGAFDVNWFEEPTHFWERSASAGCMTPPSIFPMAASMPAPESMRTRRFTG